MPGTDGQAMVGRQLKGVLVSPCTTQKDEKKAIEIVDFPIKNGDFPWQNVSSPEGTPPIFRKPLILMVI